MSQRQRRTDRAVEEESSSQAKTFAPNVPVAPAETGSRACRATGKPIVDALLGLRGAGGKAGVDCGLL